MEPQLSAHQNSVMRDKLLIALSADAAIAAEKPEQFRIEYIAPLHHTRTRTDEQSGAVIQVNFVHHSGESRTGSSKCLLPPDAFKHSRVVKSLYEFNADDLPLILFGYRQIPDHGHFTPAVCRVWNVFKRKKAAKFKGQAKYRQKKIEKLKGMATLAVTRFRHLLQDNKTDITITKLSKLLGLNATHFKRDYGDEWDCFMDIITDIENDALAHLYKSTGFEKKSKAVGE